MRSAVTRPGLFCIRLSCRCDRPICGAKDAPDNEALGTVKIDELIEDFAYLDDWEDRYRYVIELGKNLEPLETEDHSDANKVKGCVSQVWLRTDVATGEDGAPVLHFTGDSDAHIVRGLIAIVLALYSDRPAREIAATAPDETFGKIGLDEHLSPQRSNGLHAMVRRIQTDAASALADAGMAPAS